ncbi:uncharacterized protein CDAR_567061 [Caerostris darwini]|uniref:Uncharacterized protein n=1 Tax=Caerostris darwini TaxID=1538125 RepID=A0AAV4QYA7_9ARAC|nr:uncharacterized protein CDAR_567061 [Caerostris darwini]
MEEGYLRGQTRESVIQSIYQERTASIMIAITFVVCFSVFGVINLVGGTILTLMSINSKSSPKAMMILQKLARDSNVTLEYAIDPMQVIGIIILLAGVFLVVIGFSLGYIACRSVGQHRRRQARRMMSHSGQQMDSFVRSGRRTSTSFCSSSFSSSRSRSNDKKPLEKMVSPILENNGEKEVIEFELQSVDIIKDDVSEYSMKKSPTLSAKTAQDAINQNIDASTSNVIEVST